MLCEDNFQNGLFSCFIGAFAEYDPLNITVALVGQGSEGVSCNDTAWPGPDAAVSSLTNGWSGWDCHGPATAAGIAVA